MHQGSALSALLFVIVMEAMCREFRDALQWELLNVGDLDVIAESKELIKKLDTCRWKNGVQSKGMNVNMSHD